jgi:hypothetical protein
MDLGHLGQLKNIYIYIWPLQCQSIKIVFINSSKRLKHTYCKSIRCLGFYQI